MAGLPGGMGHCHAVIFQKFISNILKMMTTFERFIPVPYFKASSAAKAIRMQRNPLFLFAEVQLTGQQCNCLKLHCGPLNAMLKNAFGKDQYKL